MVRGAEVTSQIGPLLRQLRRQAGMSQEQLAEAADLSVRTIRRLETGRGSDTRVGTLRLLAEALDLSPADRRRLLAEAGAVPTSADPAEDTTAENTTAENTTRQNTAAESTAEHPPAGDGAAGGERPGGVGASPAPVRPRGFSASRDALAEAADVLAQVVSGRLRREEEQRGVHDPFPLPVRWQPLPEQLTDDSTRIHRGRRVAAAKPLDLTGDLTDIVAVYRRIPSGRLVVLGQAGSGKTILMLRFTLDYLDTRADTDPVPVIFSLGSWDPTAVGLRDWLIDQLLRDHPDLVARAPNGSTLAAALVEAGHILPVLDGFDEIADDLHGAALDALNATTLPMLVTSRPAEYTAAVEAGDVLTWSAGISLTGLTPADLVDYLPRTTRRIAEGGGGGETRSPWDPVLDELRHRPDSQACATLTAVLSTPLMVLLARTVYGAPPGRDPVELLDTARFPTADALEDHLLASFVPTVYRPEPARPATGRQRCRRNWDPDRVQRWLGYLAHHVDQLGVPDLAWWRLGDSLRRSSRILAVVLASTLVTAVVDWLVLVPPSTLGVPGTSPPGLVLVDGLLVGPVVGLAFGLVYGLLVVVGGIRFEPSRVRIRLSGARLAGGVLARTYATRFAAGVLGGFVVGLGYETAKALVNVVFFGLPLTIEVTLVDMFLRGLIFGPAAGAVFGLVSVLETPLNADTVTSPIAMLATNRATVFRQILVLVPMAAVTIGFGGRLVVDAFQGLLGPLIWDLTGGLLLGALGGLVGTLSYALAFTAWGQWVVLVRCWMPLTGRLPWAVTAFLDDAYHRGVLRQAGAVYQFRHARLQDHLSRVHQERHAAPALLGAPAGAAL